MKSQFPAAVPEIPVSNVDLAAEYYVSKLGFRLDWGGEEGGIAGISNGQCRMFLTNRAFREPYGNAAPVLVWLNLDSNEDVDQLHEQWQANQAIVVSPPESKPWGLREFTVADLDGNLLRVFHDFGTPDRGTGS
jgi:uncharacterized glyoxalase superfamily protein PhnB